MPRRSLTARGGLISRSLAKMKYAG